MQKDETLVVLLSECSHIQTPVTIHLVPVDEPIETVSHFHYLGSIVQNDCGLDIEINSRICKASHAFQSLSRILWYQRKIKTSTKVCLLNSVILPILLYGLEFTVLQPHVRRLESFLIHCLQIILGISVREQKCHTTIRKIAKQQRISSIHLQHCLHFLGHLSRMSNDCLPKQLLVSVPVGCKRNVGGQKRCWNDVVSGDLKQCNLLESWKKKAVERNTWRSIIKSSGEHFNKEAEDKEKSLSDDRK